MVSIMYHALRMIIVYCC